MGKIVRLVLVLLAAVMGFIAFTPARQRPAPGGPSVPASVLPNAASPAPAAATPAPRPQLPPLPPGRVLAAAGVHCHEISMAWTDGRPMRLFIFMPKGDYADRSLPCVVEAPSGTSLLTGADIGTAEEAATFLPFTAAGMITVIYSIDGAMPAVAPPFGSPEFVAVARTAFRSFTEADAGVRNGSAAIDYVLARVPQADPDRLFTWGHSSAATLALLLAAKDHRIRRCIALAPCTDLATLHGSPADDPGMEQTFPGIGAYLRSGSPLTHAGTLGCAVFLAHAQDDDTCPFAGTERFVRTARAAGRDITFLDLPRGGHFQEMVELSLPDALRWLTN